MIIHKVSVLYIDIAIYKISEINIGLNTIGWYRRLTNYEWNYLVQSLPVNIENKTFKSRKRNY